MPTLWSQTLIPTLREVPAEAEVPSHRLMLRAGYIRKLAAGAYDYLPLGYRSLRKAMAIVREEMERAGAAEVFLPSLQPIELWEQTGRREAYGENLFVVQDRHGRKLALGPTHEEVITELVGGYIESYKDLPKTLYQIQTKFRDEFRPRFGVLRSREFQMKDAYSFHLALEGQGGLDETYQKQYDAYCRIFERCGIPYEVVEAESGPIGGSASHEFMVPSPTGEDTILKSDKGNYAANVEKAEIGERAHSLNGPPTGELDRVHTPGASSIEAVGKAMKVKPQNMLKTMVFATANKRWAVAVVRGDHDVNEAKLKKAVGGDIALGDEAESRAAGFAIGFVGPHVAVTNGAVDLFIDPDAAKEQFWASGANEVDHHVKHFNWQRDVLSKVPAERVKVADIRNAADGDPSPKNDGGVLRTTKGIEIGHVFKLGDRYTKSLGVTVLGPNNERVTPIMGCYGIGVNRILAAAIEREGGHDDDGIRWPVAIAPYAVLITAVKWEGAMRETAEKLARELEEAPHGHAGLQVPGVDVLMDDRDERPGVKFKDADLIGIPVRITIGEKGLAEGKVEVKARNGSNGPKGELVPLGEAVSRVAALLRGA